MTDITTGQAVRDFVIQLTSYNVLHLGERAAKIQIFGGN